MQCEILKILSFAIWCVKVWEFIFWSYFFQLLPDVDQKVGRADILPQVLTGFHCQSFHDNHQNLYQQLSLTVLNSKTRWKEHFQEQIVHLYANYLSWICQKLLAIALHPRQSSSKILSFSTLNSYCSWHGLQKKGILRRFQSFLCAA